MVWFTSKDNGNVFEVQNPDLAGELEAAGHQAHDSDPRIGAVVKPVSIVKSK